MKLQSLAALATLSLVAAGCGTATDANRTTRNIQLDGSSTVFPISEAVAEEFQIKHRGRVRVTVGVSGTGGGFKKFCRGEVDIANASRPILTSEIEECAKTGVQYIELPVAYDALTVVVNPRNTWVDQITIEELKTMWEPAAQGRILTWNQVNPAWPNQPLRLFGAGSDSGTFDYFTEAAVGKAKSSRGDFTASEDDNVLVTGVESEVNALGYFGYAYYAPHKDRMKALKIVNSKGEAVGPSEQSVLDGSYEPMARPLFVYINAESAKRPEISDFIEFYFAEGVDLIKEVQYVPLSDEAYQIALGHFRNGRLGTVFGGHSEVGMRVEDVLKRDVN